MQTRDPFRNLQTALSNLMRLHTIHTSASSLFEITLLKCAGIMEKAAATRVLPHPEDAETCFLVLCLSESAVNQLIKWINKQDANAEAGEMTLQLKQHAALSNLTMLKGKPAHVVQINTEVLEKRFLPKIAAYWLMHPGLILEYTRINHPYYATIKTINNLFREEGVDIRFTICFEQSICLVAWSHLFRAQRIHDALIFMLPAVIIDIIKDYMGAKHVICTDSPDAASFSQAILSLQGNFGPEDIFSTTFRLSITLNQADYICDYFNRIMPGSASNAGACACGCNLHIIHIDNVVLLHPAFLSDLFDGFSQLPGGFVDSYRLGSKSIQLTQDQCIEKLTKISMALNKEVNAEIYQSFQNTLKSLISHLQIYRLGDPKPLPILEKLLDDVKEELSILPIRHMAKKPKLSIFSSSSNIIDYTQKKMEKVFTGIDTLAYKKFKLSPVT